VGYTPTNSSNWTLNGSRACSDTYPIFCMQQ
jgi:hypothetical protein